MQSDDFMFSPMDSAGEDRLRRVRACIHKTYGTGSRAKRSLDLAGASATPAKMQRTELHQRIERASLVSAQQLFSQEFGSSEELFCTGFDLARPAGYPTTSRRDGISTNQAVGAPTSFFSYAPATFTSSIPAPSTAAVSQLTRASRILTPRKAAIKRARAGESSDEKALVVRKPRLGAAPSSAQAVGFSSGDLSRKSFAFVTKRGEQSSASTRFLPRTSPSKFQFSSTASRLFSQRQTPLR